jgi:hypothetical protein
MLLSLFILLTFDLFSISSIFGLSKEIERARSAPTEASATERTACAPARRTTAPLLIFGRVPTVRVVQ